MQNPSWFEALRRDRQDLLDVHARNKISSGVWQAAVEKYPDPTHFVYELLQNAEDQDATCAEFDLSSAGLKFRHNGKPFSAEDVESITGWGNSSKPELENKIGRFGIGFKSVFMITDKPRVFTFVEDQPFAFSIENLFLPVAQSEDLAQCEAGWTTFWLPFWRDRAATLHQRIDARLTSLGAGTMLFLRHLQEIKWKSGAQSGAFLCERKGRRTILISSRCQGGVETVSDALAYRVFERPVQESSADRALTVKIAFRLNDKGSSVVPEAQNTLVHVYFPTEQPFPAPFLVHAPFLLTDNRANLKQDNVTNTQLVRELADLLVSALPKLRDEKLLDVTSLSALPIDAKAFATSEFRPLFAQVVDLFKREKLLPTADRTFVSTAQARLARSAELRDLISPQQLGALYDSALPIHWLHEEITENSTKEIYGFINATLGVPRLDGESFGLRLNGDFLTLQSDDWMIEFYRFLVPQEALWRSSNTSSLRGPLRYKPIIRTSDGTQAAPFDRDEVGQVFLRAGVGGAAPARVVAPQFLHNAEALSFFERLGLREPDVADEVLHQVLPRYANGKPIPADDIYERDVSLLAAALTAPSATAHLIGAVAGAFWVRAVNAATGDVELVCPADCYTRTLDLEAWFEGDEECWFLDETLEQSPDWERIQKALRAAKQKVAPATLTIECELPGWGQYTDLWDKHGSHGRGVKGFDPGATLEGLERVLQQPQERTSRMLWNLLRQHPHLIKGQIETSKYQDFQYPTLTEYWSDLGDECRVHAWLPHPNQIGKWCKPSELEIGDLPLEWDTQSEAARTVALQLGMKRSELQAAAEQLGFSVAELDFFQQNKGLIAEFRQLVETKKHAQTQRAPEFPEKGVPDAERRAQKLTRETQEAPERQYETKPRSVRVSELSRDEKREYLRGAYTNRDGQLICQMCQDEMPFKLADGHHYFEAVACLPSLRLEKQENYLALCPICAAKYQYALDQGDEELENLVAQGDEAACEIEIGIVTQAQKIRFVQSHWFDLQTILRAQEGG